MSKIVASRTQYGESQKGIVKDECGIFTLKGMPFIMEAMPQTRHTTCLYGQPYETPFSSVGGKAFYCDVPARDTNSQSLILVFFPIDENKSGGFMIDREMFLQNREVFMKMLGSFEYHPI